MDMSLWGLMTVVGPLVLLVLLIWVVVRSSKRRAGEASEATTERATRANYQAEQDAHEDEPGSGL